MESRPCRGEIWTADLEPITGHEQGGKRPCLVLSDDVFNHGPAELVVVLPITSKNREIPIRVALEPPDGGVKVRSYIMPEMIRSISTRRLSRRLGNISPDRMTIVEGHVQALLRLS